MSYLQEWQASCVDDELTKLNVIGLSGLSPAEYLLYADTIPRRNDGRVSEGFLKRYSHLEAGGWWCSGIDLLTGQDALWGCFKPDSPRFNGEDRKKIKYEHPPKTATEVFALKVPLHLWQKISDRYEVPFETAVNFSLPDLGFWQWLHNHPQVPLSITEGAKKAGALISAGYAAIGLPGIYGGYRTPKNDIGQRVGKSSLISALQHLATPEREFYFVFDEDTKPKTIQAVNTAIKNTGYLLQQKSCKVKVLSWAPRLGKGIDDLLANAGEDYLETVYTNSVSLATWKANSWQKLTYEVQQALNSPFLSGVVIPDKSKLIALKSPKGTGKTKLLEEVVANALRQKQKVLVIGHRIQLVKALCLRFGLPYITEAKATGQNTAGYGLCLDSLHPESQAKFDSDAWSDSIVIIDEIEQVLWHGLNSSTCKENRVAILQCFKNLLQNVLSSQGKVYVADADLSDLALDYLLALANMELAPYIVHNQWRKSDNTAWQVYKYEGRSPKKLVQDLETYIGGGGKPLVCLSAQKLSSKWSTQTLEVYFKQKFPQLKLLRIDSQSLADSDHPAYDCISNLDLVLSKYDVVLASPCLETGISIELKNHFTSVWAIAQGVQSSNSVCQTLARLRANVPRYLWCASYSFQKIGNGSTSIPGLISSSNRLTQLNIRLLQQSDLIGWDDVDTGFQAESLLCWAKMAVRYNASTVNYRESILSALTAEGNQVLDRKQIKTLAKIDKDRACEDTSCLIEAISEIRQSNYVAECTAIADSPLLTQAQYNALKKKVVKTIPERHCLRKYELQQRYFLPITPELIRLDDDNWYQKIRLHYFLTVGRPFLSDRDAKIAQKLIAQGNGSLFYPDFNCSQLGSTVGIMELLGIPVLLSDAQRFLRNTDQDLHKLASLALDHRAEIKTAVGIGLAVNSSPVMVVRRFLEKIAAKLEYVKIESTDKGRKRIRVYQIAIPQDNRDRVFAQWLKQDCDLTKHELAGNLDSLFWQQQQNLIASLEKLDDSYLQLSLNLD